MATQVLSPEVPPHHLGKKPIESGNGEMLLAPAPSALAIQRAPELVIEEATRAAKALTAVIESKPRKLVLNGKTYLQFEDWQTLGRFYGVTTSSPSTRYVEYGEGSQPARGFEASAEALLVGTNQVISSAQAMCLDDETNWRGKPLYQLKSMAQTRACAKALRNVLAWVVVLAGYAPTPAEEMDSDPAIRSVAATPSKDALKPQRVQEMCKALSLAADFEQLQKVFRECYSEASKAADKNAQDAYIAAKDQRRRELR